MLAFITYLAKSAVHLLVVAVSVSISMVVISPLALCVWTIYRAERQNVVEFWNYAFFDRDLEELDFSQFLDNIQALYLFAKPEFLAITIGLIGIYVALLVVFVFVELAERSP